MQAKNRNGLQHEGLQKLLSHLESCAPPCMSDAPDWEGSHGWLDAADLRSDALQLPPLHDPGKQHLSYSHGAAPATAQICFETGYSGMSDAPDWEGITWLAGRSGSAPRCPATTASA